MKYRRKSKLLHPILLYLFMTTFKIRQFVANNHQISDKETPILGRMKSSWKNKISLAMTTKICLCTAICTVDGRQAAWHSASVGKDTPPWPFKNLRITQWCTLGKVEQKSLRVHDRSAKTLAVAVTYILTLPPKHFTRNHFL